MTYPTVEVGLDELEEVLSDNLVLLGELIGSGLSDAISFALDAALTVADLLPNDHPHKRGVIDVLRGYDADGLATTNPTGKKQLAQLYLALQDLAAGRAIQQ